jgi:glucokinase
MHILAADIGGTNSRFAVFEADGKGVLRRLISKWLKTTDYSSFKDLLAGVLSAFSKEELKGITVASFAVAGLVEGGCFSRPPNISWEVDIRDIAFPVERAMLLNDFAAQAYACKTPAVEGAREILPGRGDPSSPLACVGAGTGLGQSCLIPLPEGGFVAAASEGSHTPFPFLGEEELSYGRFVQESLHIPYAECDDIVSGRGLRLLHQFITGDDLAPEEITSRFSEGSPTIERMGSFYGRVCRNYVLQTVSLGGLYIAGGIAAKAPSIVLCKGFRQEFYNSASMERILRGVPVHLNANEESGLWGAAFAALNKIKRDNAFG